MRRSIQEIEREIEQLLQDAPKAVIPKKLFENILSLNTKRGKRELNQALRSLEVQGKILIQPGNLVQLKGKGKAASKAKASSQTKAQDQRASKAPSKGSATSKAESPQRSASPTSKKSPKSSPS